MPEPKLFLYSQIKHIQTVREFLRCRNFSTSVFIVYNLLIKKVYNHYCLLIPKDPKELDNKR